MDTHPLYLTALDAALRGAVVALLVLLNVSLLRERAQLPVARVGVLLALGLCVQVVTSAPLFESDVPRFWQAPWIAVSVGNGLLFWLFVQAMFDDDFVLQRWHAAAWIAVAALSALNCLFGMNSGSVIALLGLAVQRAAPLVFSALAVYAAVANWHGDLVEGRRRLRAFILVAGVIYTVAMLAVRLASPHGR